MTFRITTSHIYPPIPARNSDWCASFDGQEEDGPYGWGATETEAIENLLSQMETFHV